MLKENITFSNEGYKTRVIAIWEPGLKRKETIKGNISVIRVKIFTKNLSKSLFVQIIKYIEYALSVIVNNSDGDVYHCNDLDALPIGVFIKRFINKNAKVVYDCHEYETETKILNGIKKELAKLLERKLIRHADAVITVNHSIADEYVRLYRIEKPYVVMNCPFYVKLKRTNNYYNKKYTIDNKSIIYIYHGSFTKGRGIEIILEAFKNLNTNKHVAVFMGFGPLKNMIESYSKSYGNIKYHKPVPPDKLLDYIPSADIGICIYENICLNNYYCTPNKLYEYIMAGLPVVVSNMYEQKEIVENNKIGIVLENNRSEDLIKVIKSLNASKIEEFKRNTNKIIGIYNWENQEKVLKEVYDRVFSY